MTKEICRVTDDAYYDYSDYAEAQGVYTPYKEDTREPEDYPGYAPDINKFFDRMVEEITEQAKAKRLKPGSLDLLLTDWEES